MNTCHPRILNDPLLYPYFKDCVGAIDGTLISAWAPVDKHNVFRSRKGDLKQNVLDVCDFNLMFTYILAGWEGSANDARILADALRRDGHFPWPPESKYYLVDSGFCNCPGFLSPYRQHRYHINTWRGAMFEPKGPEELFNKRHSRLRNVVERAFGVLKVRFPILKGPMPRYSIRRQVNIVIACVVLHNWLRANYRDDWFFTRAERGEFDPDENADNEHHILRQSQQDVDIQSQFRDTLAASMWSNR
uniref:Putative nuclease harbi1 n=1 Tax=Phtheirospermum japonicum TaxID=374723 RepID=A0A830B8Q6_9LAMI